MSRKYSKAIERLARDICWAEFARRPEGTTKTAYWLLVHPDKKAEYIEDARWLVFIAGRLGAERMLGMSALWTAARLRPTGGAEVGSPKVRTPTSVLNDWRSEAMQ